MTDMRDVFFILGKQDVVLWSDASTSPVALPDSRARQMLARVGVDRVILLLAPPYDLAAIRRAKALQP